MFDKQERTNEACRIYSEALVELGKQIDVKVINLWAAFQHRDDWSTAYLRYSLQTIMLFNLHYTVYSMISASYLSSSFF